MSNWERSYISYVQIIRYEFVQIHKCDGQYYTTLYLCKATENKIASLNRIGEKLHEFRIS